MVGLRSCDLVDGNILSGVKHEQQKHQKRLLQFDSFV